MPNIMVQHKIVQDLKNSVKYVACYVRVSTEEQVKYGFSIEAQKDALEKYCIEHGYKFDFYIDEGVSASSMRKRKALNKMLSKASIYDMILFTKLDRLSRNVLDANNINKLLKENNCTMKAIDEDDVDTSTADGLFMFNLKVSLAQREIEKTSERINFVFANKRAKGEVTSGTTKYGYDIIDKRFVINKKQQQKIIAFYKYYLEVAGDTFLSYTYYKENFPHKSYDSYTKMLTETSYIGLYKRYRKNEFIEGYIPALMSTELFMAVQNVYTKKRRITKNGKEAPITLFDGLLKCNVCKCALCRKISYRETATYISYNCWKSERLSFKSGETYKCSERKHTSERIIELALINMLENEAKKYITNSKVLAQQESKNSNTELAYQLRKKLEKLKDLYIDDLIDKETYKADYNKITEELARLEIQSKPVASRDYSALEELINSDFKTIYFALSPIEKRRFWITILDTIYMQNGKIERIVFK